LAVVKNLGEAGQFGQRVGMGSAGPAGDGYSALVDGDQGCACRPSSAGASVW
jgi:hypothetical protein